MLKNKEGYVYDHSQESMIPFYSSELPIAARQLLNDYSHESRVIERIFHGEVGEPDATSTPCIRIRVLEKIVAVELGATSANSIVPFGTRRPFTRLLFWRSLMKDRHVSPGLDVPRG